MQHKEKHLYWVTYAANGGLLGGTSIILQTPIEYASDVIGVQAAISQSLCEGKKVVVTGWTKIKGEERKDETDGNGP